MAITTVIVTILVSITSLALETFNRNRVEVSAARQGEAMVDTIANDLESLVIRSGNNFEWLYAKSNPPSDGPNGTTSPNSLDLVFFSSVTDRYNGEIGESDDQGGDVSTLVYQLAYEDPISDDEKFKSFILYRKLINPDKTFGSGTSSGTLGTVYTTPSSDDLFQAAEDADSDPSITGNEISNAANFICENIYQFTITFHVDVQIPSSGSDGSFTTRSIQIPITSDNYDQDPFKITGNGIISETIPAGLSGETDSEEILQSGNLTAVEVSLSVLSDFGIEQMRNRNMSGTELNEFVAKNSYQYSKLVLVPGG